ncbi:MAG TPA: exo-alpha-sialidase [Candidatus Paceibacterota bacterium]|nr:exo-alpha-sialidase [Verrucomicrobiota bacterium]HRY50276.1 exo-alpha-sialidase [Candidatus Paceibacterota bacterium]
MVDLDAAHLIRTLSARFFRFGNTVKLLTIGILLSIGVLSHGGNNEKGVIHRRPANLSPFYESELLFPLEVWHNHASCIVETPRGDLLVCWFHGSGERKADDVRIEGARKRRGSKTWSQRFLMADTPGFPDTNCAMFIDPAGHLWLIWPTIMANLWESALLKYRVSSDYHRKGCPRWSMTEVLHIKPGPEFETEVEKGIPALRESVSTQKLSEETRREVQDYLAAMSENATNKLYRRLGWMTRAHPIVLDHQRLIVPLYHDGFSFSLMAISDDWGATWHTSTPLVGGGNIQPSIVQKSNGSLFTVMRDNGPPPKRLLQSESFDRGETWSKVIDSQLPNPGSGAELIVLDNGHWVLVGNDTEQGRHSLTVQISEDEGRIWKWKRHLEYDPPGTEAGAYHYPSLIQARDGSLHVSYSYHLNQRNLARDVDGDPAAKSIKHAHFNEAWVKQGDTVNER